MRFIVEEAERLSPVASATFDAVMSFAAGGLGNAWGAGLYRCNDSDLAGFPIGASDLEPFYDALTEKIGLSGADDDLGRFFGSARGLLPPLRLDANGARLLRRYRRRREKLNRAGLYVGRPRLADGAGILNPASTRHRQALIAGEPRGARAGNVASGWTKNGEDRGFGEDWVHHSPPRSP